jgi:hypothetical protein
LEPETRGGATQPKVGASQGLEPSQRQVELKNRMAEVGLNLLWLLVVAASVVGWTRTRHRLSGGRRRQLSSEVFALGMALAILWIPISITDNLHPAVFQAEDAGNTKRITKSCGRSLAVSSHGAIPPLLALLVSARPDPNLTVVCLLPVPRSASWIVRRAGNPLSSRAPPSL